MGEISAQLIDAENRKVEEFQKILSRRFGQVRRGTDCLPDDEIDSLIVCLSLSVCLSLMMGLTLCLSVCLSLSLSL